MSKKIIKTSYILILIVAVITLGFCWHNMFDASTDSPNLITCKKHKDIDLDMSCDKCGAILPFTDYAEFKTIETISKEGSIVKVEGNMLSNTSVIANEVENETAIELAKKYVTDISKEDVLCAFDISMLVDNEKFQPKDYGENVKINISDITIPEKENLALLHILEDETYEIVPIVRYSDTEIEFNATSFSTYIVISLGSYNITFTGTGNFKVVDNFGVDIQNGKTISGGNDLTFSIVPDEDYEVTTITASAGSLASAGDGFGKTCKLSNIVSNVTITVNTLVLPEFSLEPATAKVELGKSGIFTATSENAQKVEWEYREDVDAEWKNTYGKIGFITPQGKTSMYNTGAITEEYVGYEFRCLIYASETSTKPRYSNPAMLVSMQNILTADVKLSSLPNAPIFIPSRPSGVWGNTDVRFTMVAGGNMTTEQIIQYKIGDGEWQNYVDEVTIGAEGVTKVYGRTINASDSNLISNESAIEIRIDKTAPIINIMGQSLNKVSFTAEDKESGLMGWAVTSNMSAPITSLTEILPSGDKLNYWYPTENGTLAKVNATFEKLNLGTYYIWAKDVAGNITEPLTITIYKDIMAPFGTIKVIGNDVEGLTYVNNSLVNLELTVTDNVSEPENIKMKLYNKDEFENLKTLENIEWEDFEKNKTFSLTNDDGAKRIYMLLKDEAGNVSLALK